MNENKLKSRPPGPAAGDVEDFIAGAATRTVAEAGSLPQSTAAVPEHEPYPWESPGVRGDITKLFNLRLPEPYFLKLKWIAEHSPESMHQFCLSVLLPAIDAKIEELIGKD